MRPPLPLLQPGRRSHGGAPLDHQERKPWSTAGPSTTLPCPVPVENRAPASSSSQIRPSPSSPPADASMTCCNLRGRSHPFLRVSKPLHSVRFRLTTLVCLLHGLDLLPSGISGKITISLDTTIIIAMLVVSFLLICLATYHLFVKPPKMS